MSLFSRSLALAAMILCAAVSSSGQDLGKLPFVPTPEAVVEAMIKLAAISPGDVVADLGSGDGRLVITAARERNASGFGVDIDPRLVALSNQNAKSAGVADRVKFIQGDMFKAEIDKASVLMLYVLPDFMSKLRPKVLTELKPGTRVVAHDYYFTDWYPDQMLTLTVPEKVRINGTDKAYLYLWIVPAVVKGAWRLFFDITGKTEELSVTFQQEYQMLSATGERAGKAVAIENPALKGNDIKFGLTLDGNAYELTGKVIGDKIEGKAAGAGGARQWLARKMP
jgi:hypothetical protein